MKNIHTVRFGDLTIDEKSIVHFAQGIPAFEDEHDFVLIPYDEESPYLFLQSCTTPDLAFLMTDPYLFFKDYEFEIDDATEKKLGLMTANLMAPVIINQNTLDALQLVLEKSPYKTKHRLFRADAGKEAR